MLQAIRWQEKILCHGDSPIVTDGQLAKLNLCCRNCARVSGKGARRADRGRVLEGILWVAGNERAGNTSPSTYWRRRDQESAGRVADDLRTVPGKWNRKGWLDRGEAFLAWCRQRSRRPLPWSLGPICSFVATTRCEAGQQFSRIALPIP